MPGDVTHRLRLALGAGDRRALGHATEIARQTLDNPLLVPDLLACLCDDDETVVSHAAHAVMQVGAQTPGLFQPHAAAMIDILDRRAQWEIGEQLPKVLAELDYDAARAERLLAVLRRLAAGPSAIAAASALSAVGRLAERGIVVRQVFELLIADALRSPKKAVAARARRLMEGRA
ncbi:MAG: hypothetical protein R3D45_08705 [Rhizobiaceae bacterium]